MNYLKTLGVVAIVSAAGMAFAGNASGTILTSPEGTTYTGTIKAQSSNLKLDGTFVTVESEDVELEGSVSEHGAARTVRIPLSFVRWARSNYLARLLSFGSLEWHSLGGGNGTITWSGLGMEIDTSVGTCTFTTNNTHIGTFTGGWPPMLHINSAKIPRTGGNFLCGSSGTLTGSLQFSTPSSLYTD